MQKCSIQENVEVFSFKKRSSLVISVETTETAGTPWRNRLKMWREEDGFLRVEEDK